MRAAVLLGKEAIRVEEVTPASLQAGEVRVRIEAALTCGTDLKVFKRGYHARMLIPPAVFGHEFAGVISELAPDLTSWRPGERVAVANSAPCGCCFYCQNHQENLCDDLLFLNGAYARSIVIPARIVQKNLLRLRPETDFCDAALVEPLACVVQGVEDSGLRAGQRVLSAEGYGKHKTISQITAIIAILVLHAYQDWGAFGETIFGWHIDGKSWVVLFSEAAKW